MQYIFISKFFPFKSFSEQYVVHESKYYSGTPSVLGEWHEYKPLSEVL